MEENKLFSDSKIGSIEKFRNKKILIVENLTGNCETDLCCGYKYCSQTKECPFACVPEDRKDEKYVYFIELSK